MTALGRSCRARPTDAIDALASQPTLSWFTALMVEPANRSVLREAVLVLAGEGIMAERRGKKLPCVTLDVDFTLIDVHGHQPQAGWNGT